MVFAIRHKGLESPEIRWRKNLREDSLRLGEELHGKHAKRPEMDMRRIANGIIRPHEAAHFKKVALYGSMRAELPKSFRNGTLLAQMGPISEITNFTSSTTYARIDDAIYMCTSGDEIILPAGSGATHSASFMRYSNFSQLNSHVNGYSGDSSVVMVIGNPSQNTAGHNATYMSIVGIASSNNLSSVTWASTSGGQLTATISGSPVTVYRRGQYVRISGATNTGTGGAVPGLLNSINNTFYTLSVSGSVLTLAAPASGGVYGTIGGSPVLNNDRAQLSAPVGYLTVTLNPGDATIVLDDAGDFDPGGGFISAWGNGDTTWFTEGMTYGGVSGNTLTGVDSSSLGSPVPIGNPIVGDVLGGKALITPAATNATGITFSNLELWGAISGTSAGAIFQWVNEGGEADGNLTLNNVFLHDGTFGIRPGSSSDGTATFIDIIDSELWRCGSPTGLNHNMYVDSEVLTFYNSLSWFGNGSHLVKSRCRANYCMYSRAYGAHGTAANPLGNIWSSCFDFPNAGLVYLIGCDLVASLHDANITVQFGEEAAYPPNNANRGAANPLAEIYVANCNILGPSDGMGVFQTNVAPISIGYPGLKNPELPFVTTTSGGALPARTYWFATSLFDADGNESLPSVLVANDAFSLGITAETAIGSGQLAVVTSPVVRTGAVSYNVWAAHADPLIWYSGSAIPPATGPNQFFYDSGFTQPVSVVNSGGSLPASFVFIAITYVFAEGESIKLALNGADLRFATTQSPAALLSIPVNSFLTLKSPPSISGATGWYPSVALATWNAGGFYSNFFPSIQVDTPIAIGTDWVQSTAFRRAEQLQRNFYKQNASPIAIGTDWTEPTSGLANFNANLLKWRRRGNDDSLGFSRWFAKATGNYTNYVVNAYTTNQDGNYYQQPIAAIVQVWSGSATPWPFDADYTASALTTSAASTTVTTAAATTVAFAAFRNSAAAGSGWTLAGDLGFLMSEYQAFSSPQTGAAVTQSGGGSTSILVDAITGTSLTLRGSAQESQGTANTISFTIPTINTGDVLIMDIAAGNSPIILSIDPLATGPQSQNQALAHSPVGLIVNNAIAYYNPTAYGAGGYIQTYPGAVHYAGVGYPTVSSFNLQVNAYNGSGFDAPLVGAVWTNAADPGFDFTLAGSSPLLSAGTNPGTGGGHSLVPTFQSSMVGEPTPGFPIQALTARTDSGGTLGAIGSGSGPPPPPASGGPGRRIFGWDWRVAVTVGSIALLEQNPILSRRKLMTGKSL